LLGFFVALLAKNYCYFWFMQQPIGVFDSGYGGLTVLKSITQTLPQYDYLYLGDNARAPYGTRSFDTIYEYTLECVQWLFNQGCHLVILACNTASARALRTIQQKNLPTLAPNKRVLGVIRPTAEILGQYSKTNHIGILATQGTVSSESYTLELQKFWPNITVHQQACPMWVPLIENNQHQTTGANYFIQTDVTQLLANSPTIDTILLGCTHYPIIQTQIQQAAPGVTVINQGRIVANSLANYLERHPQLAAQCSKNGQTSFFTTDAAADFNAKAPLFYNGVVNATHVDLHANR
jgi:glutamate racemase